MRPVRVPATIRSYPRAVVLVLAATALAMDLAVGAILPAVPPKAGPPADVATVNAWLEGQLRDSAIPGAALVVVQDGRVVETRGFGVADASGRPVEATTPFVLGSLSKSMTALAIMQLVEAGRVDLDAPVRAYLPSFTLADPAVAERITVRELLTHTSGIPTSAGLAPLRTPETSLAAQVDALRSVAPAGGPGAAYAYSNANYLVLGRLIEVVSGETYGAYVARHVFAPLGMDHATTDRATAVAGGLGQAHRLFFGLADAHAPLFREDLAPAGFIAASADDMGRFLLAELGAAGPTGGRVVSPASLAVMQTGTASTGLAGERMGMGWVDTSLDGERIVAHSGSTTDMAAIEVLVPSRHLGVAVLFDAQSVPYELLRKPDALGLGVVSLLMGYPPGGTLALFYPVFDLAVAALLLILLRGLYRAGRGTARAVGASRAAGGERLAAETSPAGAPTSGRRLPLALRPVARLSSIAIAVYLCVVFPVAVFVLAPSWLGAGWPTLVRTDLGLTLVVAACLRALIGIVRFGGWAIPALSGLGRRVPVTALE